MVGYFSVYLGSPYGVMPHHLADGFYRDPVAQADKGRETVPGNVQQNSQSKRLWIGKDKM